MLPERRAATDPKDFATSRSSSAISAAPGPGIDPPQGVEWESVDLKGFKPTGST
jgi:hypothetical protein